MTRPTIPGLDWCVDPADPRNGELVSLDITKASEIYDTIRRHPECPSEIRDNRDPVWSGASSKDLAQLLRSGDPDAVAAIRAHAAKVERTLDGLPGPMPAVCGGSVCVPAYLAGAPTCFSRLRPTEAKNPACVWVCVFYNSGHTAESYRNGLVTAITLARSLARAQPTVCKLVYQVSTPTVPFQTTMSIDLRTVDWGLLAAILSPAFFRILLINLREWVRESGSYVKGYGLFRTPIGAKVGDTVITADDLDLPVADLIAALPNRVVRSI